MPIEGERRAVLITGPTASGKSRLALARARRLGGVVVNTDAMQVYAGLPVLTAQPTAAETAELPHRLYGFLAPAVRFSTGAWAEAVKDVLAEAEAAGRVPVFVGGTGLYFEALTKGFADVPPVPPEVNARIAAELAGLDAEGRAALIAARDPEMARRLKAPDPQRVGRALAVLAATGRSLAWFQDQAQKGLLADYNLERIVLNPDPAELRQRIDARFDRMLHEGAIAEVEALLAGGLDASLPAMKAIGVREIGALLAGRISREEAVRRAVIATSQYAKRQRTWLRHRMADWHWMTGAAED